MKQTVKKRSEIIHSWLFDVVTFLFTKAWGHMLIPTLLGTIFWSIAGFWQGWEFFFWLVWIGMFLVIGWILTVAAWVRYYWEIYRPKE